MQICLTSACSSQKQFCLVFALINYAAAVRNQMPLNKASLVFSIGLLGQWVALFKKKRIQIIQPQRGVSMLGTSLLTSRLLLRHSTKDMFALEDRPLFIYLLINGRNGHEGQ